MNRGQSVAAGTMIGNRGDLLGRDGPRADDVRTLRDDKEFTRQVRNRISCGYRRCEVRDKAVSLLDRRKFETPGQDARIPIQIFEHDQIPL